MPVGVAFGQRDEKPTAEYVIGAQYRHEFLLDGFVRVREWELIGDKMKLKDLGVEHYPAVHVYLTKRLKEDRTLTLSYDHYYIRGHATFDRDIAYNGTIIDGRKGIDVSPTRYFRLRLNYHGALWKSPSLEVGYVAGVVFDHVKFYLDGELAPSSTRYEVYEGFGRQAFPYPALGIHGRADLPKRNHLKFEIAGTYVPAFKSFYKEGGRVYLHYRLIQADVNYSWNVSGIEIIFGLNLRHMHLFQESAEDTNILDMTTAGPYVGMSYHIH